MSTTESYRSKCLSCIETHSTHVMERIKDHRLRDSIGLLLKQRRKNKGVLQRDLGKRVNLSRNYISLIERGKRVPSYKTLVAIAAELDTDIPSLIAATKSQSPDPELRLAYLLATLLKSSDKEKLMKLAKFVESLG
jgi:transcriptional regulator with XRE-family HTH domain